MIRRCLEIATDAPHDGRRVSAKLPWRAASLSMALLLLPTVLGAQLHKLDRPVDSPLWWTLTDEMPPAELKRLHTDRSLALERYDAAVAAGLERPLPERGPQARECLLFYFNGDLTPELQPMWQAFDWFLAFHAPGEHASEQNVRAAPRDLQRFGVSPSGVDAILNAAAATQAEFDSLMADFGPKMRRMTILLREVYDDPRRAAAVPPEGQVYDAALRKDYATVASALGRPEDEIRALVDSYADWDEPYALIAEALPRLKEEVTEPDWQGFRRYLLEVVVAGGGASKHFAEYCGGAER